MDLSMPSFKELSPNPCLMRLICIVIDTWPLLSAREVSKCVLLYEHIALSKAEANLSKSKKIFNINQATNPICLSVCVSVCVCECCFSLVGNFNYMPSFQKIVLLFCAIILQGILNSDVNLVITDSFTKQSKYLSIYSVLCEKPL